MVGLGSVPRLAVRRRSVVGVDDAELGLAPGEKGDRLAVLARSRSSLARFEGDVGAFEDRWLLVGPTSARNLTELRGLLPWLTPRPLGLRRSFGFGDRLGLATPGHIRALRAAGQGLAPLFAQQSIREMERTGRSPQRVLDDATWGVFAEGWRDGFGADADHLKTTADVDACVSAGYTFFTFDPGAFVDATAESRPSGDLRAALDALPWDALHDSLEEMLRRYQSFTLDLGDRIRRFDEETVARAALKYGRAVAHVAALYRHLASRREDVEVEISVDETETPTTPAQHAYVACELRRLGVAWVSLAPRFVGRFEKGVDYIGDPRAFEADAAVHAAIARRLGPYKLSLHSGSDKFTVYDALARQAGDLVHVKTAGTSYLEALRTIAALDPRLFRAIYALACERYEQDRATYHVSADLRAVPAPGAVAEAALPSLLEDAQARQVLHVTFGSVLARHGDELRGLLRTHPERYEVNLERHFVRHLSPFAAPEGGRGG
jgi:tagaturonate epimerase